jgi:hypothetical protein
LARSQNDWSCLGRLSNDQEISSSMRRDLLHLMFSWPLVTALVGWAPAQDGPLLPGFESSAPIEDASTTLEPPTTEAPILAPTGDDIRPLDANGNPQSGPPIEGELALPEPPAIESKVEEPPKSNWLQKSTETIRGLTKPDSREPEFKTQEPNSDDKKTRDTIRNWQMLRRQPTTPGQAAPGMRAQPQGTMQPGTTRSNRSIQSQSPMKSQRTVPSQSQVRPPVGVEAKNRAYQPPSSRRQVQAIPDQRHQAKSRMGSPLRAADPRRTVDNGPRSPWERPSTARLRPAAPAIKAAPTRGTGTQATTLRSALGLDSPQSK